MNDIIINASLAKTFGLNLEQSMLYSWIIDNSAAWEVDEFEGLDFSIIRKKEMLTQVALIYKSASSLQSALLKLKDLNLMIIGKDKNNFAVCLNQDLKYRWRIANKNQLY